MNCLKLPQNFETKKPFKNKTIQINACPYDIDVTNYIYSRICKLLTDSSDATVLDWDLLSHFARFTNNIEKSFRGINTSEQLQED